MTSQSMRAVAAAATIAIALGSASGTTANAQITSGVVVVANQQSSSATIIDVATRAATTVDVGVGPHEAVVSPDGKWAVVTIYGGPGAPGNQIAVIDLATKKVAKTIDL